MKYQTELFDLIREDTEFTEVFQILNQMHLPQAYICGGAIRDFVWNKQTNQTTNLRLGNIDIFYVDPGESNEQALIRQTQINQKYSKYLWNLTNIALPQRHTSKLILGKDILTTLQMFPETCSAVGIACDQMQNLSLVAPYGLEDLFELKVRPTPAIQNAKDYLNYQKRLERKKWQRQWPELTLIN